MPCIASSPPRCFPLPRLLLAAWREPSASEESPAASRCTRLSEQEIGELTEAVRELATVVTTLSSLQEGFALHCRFACRQQSMASKRRAVHGRRPTSLSLPELRPAPPNVAASVISVIVDRVGRARTADEIFRIARSYKEELPILARDWRTRSRHSVDSRRARSRRSDPAAPRVGRGDALPHPVRGGSHDPRSDLSREG